MKFFKSVLFCCLTTAFVVGSFAFSFAGSKPIEFTFSTFFPPTHIQAKLLVDYGNEIEKRTNGRVKFIHFPGSSLLKGPGVYDGVVKGITDIGESVFAYTRGRFPSIEAIDLPMGYPSGVAATKIINDFYNKFKFKEFEDVKVLYLFAHGPGLLFSKKAVANLEELKGLKIRSTGTSAAVSKALGACPVSMPQNSTYEALQKGVVEATWGPIEVLKGWKQGEVIKYMIDCYSVGYTQGFFVAMNKKKWDSLPQDIQKVFEEVSAEWIVKTGEAWDSSDEEGRQFSLSLGNKTITLSEEESARWAAAVQPVMEDYIKAVEKKGLPGRDYVDFIKEEVEKYKAN
ncbi:MAG: TRAP transporter substrate-binding protein [Thermodesulfobacteriota bacterium]|nr:TRAP transporter substrate-binding protein [Thermodesulfobacteriota bacterium]